MKRARGPATVLSFWTVAAMDRHGGGLCVRAASTGSATKISVPGSDHASEGTPRVFGHRGTQGDDAPGWAAAYRLAGAVAGRMGHGAADGAHGDLAAAGPAAAAG